MRLIQGLGSIFLVPLKIRLKKLRSSLNPSKQLLQLVVNNMDAEL